MLGCRFERGFAGIDWVVFTKMHLDTNVLYRVAGDNPIGDTFREAFTNGRHEVAWNHASNN